MTMDRDLDAIIKANEETPKAKFDEYGSTLPTSFNNYQAFTKTTAIYPKDFNTGVAYLALGLAGESGEVAEKVKKYLRMGNFATLDHDAVGKELGDILWYVSQMASHLGFTLQQVADGNVTKLTSRKMRQVLQGEGDNR